MASRSLYKGYQCKGNCSGHRAGARYAKKGGQTPSPYSASFNRGMKLAQGAIKPKKRKRGKR